jgi:hypothetical protein
MGQLTNDVVLRHDLNQLLAALPQTQRETSVVLCFGPCFNYAPQRGAALLQPLPCFVISMQFVPLLSINWTGTALTANCP